MNRGERIANRTKSAVKKALLELIRKKNYPTITVGEITKTGDVGRSTFYRHYQSKAEVLVDIHRDMFEALFRPLSDSRVWLDPKPAPELISFLEDCQQLGKNPFSLTYKLGTDLDYLITHINRQLFITIENALKESYPDKDLNLPLPILAQSVSSLFSGMIMSWFTRFQWVQPREFAMHIHRSIRALILEALESRA